METLNDAFDMFNALALGFGQFLNDGVNSLPKPELSYSAGVCFFCLYFSDSLSVTDKKTAKTTVLAGFCL